MNDFSRISYRDGDTTLTGLFAGPTGQAKAAVLVFPTIMNPTEAVLHKAQALADAGYLAMVADFYGTAPATMDDAREQALAIRQTPELYRQRLRAALRALAGEPDAAELPLLCIGFCMGGQAALEMARDGAPFEAVVSFHGLLNTDLPAEPGRVSARILVCHGDADPMVPRKQVIDFWEEMDAAGANWHFHSYSGVKHGFTNPGPTSNPATAYDKSADRQSWAAMMELFEEVIA